MLALGITACAFVLSFAVLRDLAQQAGMPTELAFLFPLIVDGAILGATIAAVALSKISGNDKGKSFFMGLLVAVVCISVVGNAYHAFKGAEQSALRAAAGIDVGTTPLTPAASAVIAVIAPLLVLAFTHGAGILIQAIGNAYTDYNLASENSVPAQEVYVGDDAEAAFASEVPVGVEADDPLDAGPLLLDEADIFGADFAAEPDPIAEPAWITELPAADSYHRISDTDADADADSAPLASVDGPDQTVEALLVFIDGANLHPGDKDTARRKILDPSLTFDVLAEMTGARSADLALRRYKRAEEAAIGAGFTVPPLPVVSDHVTDLKMAVAAA
ncbi:MAG: DUF2637 domain-containing protein [Rhodococcus sp. (in: high G+C Gram-positive bacteria)]|uniref:DUF2637 domain-containing protein n=1 Tax=Rhodococcus sp. TaxID=1831 RepID=UPI003BAEED1D